jgi:hypothetical protein
MCITKRIPTFLPEQYLQDEKHVNNVHGSNFGISPTLVFYGVLMIFRFWNSPKTVLPQDSREPHRRSLTHGCRYNVTETTKRILLDEFRRGYEVPFGRPGGGEQPKFGLSLGGEKLQLYTCNIM